MPELRPEISGVTVVLVGSFNPVVFHPSWFSGEDLLSEAEAKAATVEVIAPQVAAFQTDWLRLMATSDHFLTSSLHEPSNRVENGVFFNLNDHYEFDKDDSADRALDVLTNCWTGSLDRSGDVARQLLTPKGA